MEITLEFIAAQIFGLLTLTFSVVSVQMKKRTNILLLFAIAGAFAAVAYWFLGAYNGLALDAIGVVATIFGLVLARKNKMLPKWSLVAFAILSIAIWAIFYTSPIDLAVLVAQIIYFGALAFKKPNLVRVMMMLNMLCWLVYNASVGAYANVANNLFFLGSDAIALWRYRGGKRKNGKTKNNRR
jgi:hypothetical protein